MSIAGLFIALALSAFFSGAEVAFVAADRIRCEIALRTAKGGARLAYGFVHNPERFIFTTLVGNNVATVVFSALAALLLEPYLSPGAIIVTSAAVLLLVGEIIPKTLFRERAQRAIRTVAYPLRFFELALWPLNFALQRAVLALVGPKAADARATYALFSRKDLAVLVRESFAAGKIAPHEREMISRLLRLTTRPVRAIMVPRVDVVALPIEAGMEQAQRLFRQSGYSRLPVYQGTLDNIKGVIYVRDLLGRPPSLANVVRQVIFVPELSSCYKLLLEFRRAGVAVAIAVDEYGGTAGLVTLEDVLEELFGEIGDEHDEDQPLWRALPGGDLWVDGRLSVEELGSLLGWKFPHGPHRTIAGLAISHTGRIPRRGDVIDIGPYRLQVLRATRKRIVSLKLSHRENGAATRARQR